MVCLTHIHPYLLSIVLCRHFHHHKKKTFPSFYFIFFHLRKKKKKKIFFWCQLFALLCFILFYNISHPFIHSFHHLTATNRQFVPCSCLWFFMFLSLNLFHHFAMLRQFICNIHSIRFFFFFLYSLSSLL